MKMSQAYEMVMNFFEKYCDPRYYKVGNLCDRDLDGVACGSSIYHIFQYKFQKPPIQLLSDHEVPDSVAMCEKVKAYDFDALITADVPYYRIHSTLAKHLLCSDHHIPSERSHPPENTFILNTNNLEDLPFQAHHSEYPICMIWHNLSKVITGTTHPSWKTLSGLINDKCDHLFEDFAEEVYKEWSVDKNSLIDIVKLFNYSAYSSEEDATYAFEKFIKALEPEDILFDERLNQNAKEMEQIIKNCVNQYKEKAELTEAGNIKLLIYDVEELGTDKPIQRFVATELAEILPDYVIIAKSAAIDGYARFSFRNKIGKINVGKLAEYLAIRIENGSGGGGSSRASGLFTKEEDSNKVKDIVIEVLSNLNKSRFYS
jgi:hypothetical protein